VGAVPGPAVRVRSGIGGLGQRAVHLLAVLRVRGAVGGRTHEGVVEPHPRTELDQSHGLGRRHRAHLYPEPLGHPPEQRDVADRFGRRHEQQPSRRGGQGPDAAQEALLDPTGQRPRVGPDEPAGQLGRGPPPRQLQQGQRVAAGLGDDPVAHPLVEPAGDRRLQQRAGVPVAQAGDHELRQPDQLILVRPG
jgi:hypothetical protein